ncbi:hypothetical protein HDF11_005255 [Tunturiibacter psychrotolerans]|jgi:hypothetical protein
MSAQRIVKSQYYVKLSQANEIRKRSLETGVPQSEIVRRLLAVALAEPQV